MLTTATLNSPRFHDDVAQLTGDASGPDERTAIHNDGSADSGAKSQHHDRMGTLPGPSDRFGIARGIGIVFQHNRKAQSVTELLTQGPVCSVNIR